MSLLKLLNAKSVCEEERKTDNTSGLVSPDIDFSFRRILFDYKKEGGAFMKLLTQFLLPAICSMLAFQWVPVHAFSLNDSGHGGITRDGNFYCD